ncbi:MAG: ABC transporter ATP-binding protein [Desulfovibrio sp.]|jgi:NitT/TauT family transport system ATP-binding protein|nr:ABC transporter ATP-binding protein [Desulfovibrio sp.]
MDAPAAEAAACCRTEGRIVFDRVAHSFPGGSGGSVTEAVADFSLEIEQGSFVCLLGPSGCGKSTILNLAAGFERPSGGRVLVGGRPVTGPGPDRGIVFQDANLLPWRNVLKNITLGPELAGRPWEETLSAARRFIRLTGLEGFERHAPYELSGGMRQRVALARAWITEPPFLLMDEPFGALDAQTRLSMQELLTSVRQVTGATVLFVTHDVDEALFLADKTVVMTPRPGRIRQEILVPFPQPRDYERLILNPAFMELKYDILHAIRRPEYEI